MKAIYNGEILDSHDILLTVDDRGFRYGDGLFETIAVVNEHPRFVARHYERITKGAQILRLDLLRLSEDQLEAYCNKLIQVNRSARYAKIRFTMWRKGGGLYAPAGNEFDFLLTLHPLDALGNKEIYRVGFSSTTKNYPTETSGFKTISALKYVLAGIEKKERGLEEIIINDHNGFVSETLDSNLFIKKDGIYLTPPLPTGCVNGVMRNYLMEKLKSLQYAIEERFFIPNELLDADAVFATNALGIKHIMKIDDATFEKDSRIERLLEDIS